MALLGPLLGLPTAVVLTDSCLSPGARMKSPYGGYGLRVVGASGLAGETEAALGRQPERAALREVVDYMAVLVL